MIRIIVLVISVAIYYALTITMISLNSSLTEIATLPFKKIGVTTVVQKEGQIPEQMTGAIFPHSNGPIDQASASSLSQLEFVQGSDQGLYFWFFSNDNDFKTVLGIEQSEGTFSEVLKLNLIEGDVSVQGKKSLITADFAQKKDLELGDNLDIGDRSFLVAGILQSNLTNNIIPADVYIDLDEAQDIAYSSEEMQRIYQFENKDFVNVISLNTDSTWQGDKDVLIKEVDGNLIVFSEKTFSSQILEQLTLVSELGKIMFTMLGAIILIVFSLLVLYNFKTREKEIAVLRMIGWRYKDLKKQFISESFIVLTISLIIGNVVALLSLKVLSLQTISMELPWEISAKPHFLPAENAINRTISANIPIHIDVWSFIGVSILFLLIFITISYFAFLRIKNIKPAEYLK